MLKMHSTCLQSSATDKPNAHRDAVYRDTHRGFDRQVYQEVEQESTKKSTKSLLKPPIKSNYQFDRKVTEADFE